MVFRPDGKAHFFTLTNGLWLPDSDITDTLIQLKDTSGLVTGWRYTTSSDEIETYDATGKLIYITNRAGLTQTLAYDASDRLQSVSDPFGRQLGFSYNAQNRISTMIDPAGGVYAYAYDANNNLSSVTYPDGKSRTYLYENPAFKNALTGIIDENSARYATYAYDAQGRAISSEHAGGADKYTLGYNSDGSTLVTDPLGTARRYAFQTILGVVKNTSVATPCANCGASAANAYDANGNVASRTDFNGNKTVYAYDLVRNLEISRTEAAGTAEARTIVTAWHPVFRLPIRIDEPGRSTGFSYDERGNLLQKNLTAGNQERTWSYTHNQWGQILTVDGPRTDVPDVTRYDYDGQGNLTRITNALGQVTQIIAHDANGRPLTLIDPNLNATQLAYDARGRLIRRAVENEITTYAYDGVGQLTRLTQPDGSVLSYTYDAAHRLTQIADGQGNRIVYTLDGMGNRLQENILDPAGQLTRTRIQAYDSLNRLAQILDSQNHATAYSYDANGNLTATTDANGAATRNSYDPLNRLVQSLDPLGGATRTQYDALDQITQVTDPINVATAYQVDGLGNVSSETSPDSGNTASTFDAAGNLTTRTDATGATLGYSYDALNRLTQITNGTTPLVTYSWDGATPGKLAQIQDPGGSTQYRYDPYGRLIAKTQIQGGLSQTLGYAWNPGGLLASLTTPAGNQIGYTYAHGKINSISVNGQVLLTHISHEPFGPVSGWSWGNGQAHVRAHGLDGEVMCLS